MGRSVSALTWGNGNSEGVELFCEKGEKKGKGEGKGEGKGKEKGRGKGKGKGKGGGKEGMESVKKRKKGKGVYGNGKRKEGGMWKG